MGGVGPAGLHADDAHLGLERPRRDGYARDQATAADGHDERVNFWRSLEDLERNRALAGHHGRIVERVDVGQSFELGDAQRFAVGFVEHVAMEHDARAVAARG